MKGAYQLPLQKLKWLKVSHLECDLHQELHLSRVAYKECLLQILQISIH